MADGDPERANVIAEQWTLRELLTALEIRMSREVREEYWHQLTLHALLAPWVKDIKPPQIPALLKDDDAADP